MNEATPEPKNITCTIKATNNIIKQHNKQRIRKTRETHKNKQNTTTQEQTRR